MLKYVCAVVAGLIILLTVPVFAQTAEAPKTGPVQYEEVRAIVQELISEFTNELADLRNDVDYLQDDVWDLADRLAALEQGEEPAVEATGWRDYRLSPAAIPPSYCCRQFVPMQNAIDNHRDMRSQFNSIAARLALVASSTDDLYENIYGNMRDAALDYER